MKELALCLLLCVLGAACSSQPPPDGTRTDATQVVHLTAAEAAATLEAGDLLVVDVRTPAEHAAGHIRGARNVDYRGSDFKGSLASLSREQPVLVHCGSGGRSTASLAVFEELGFRKVYHLDGGLNAWRAGGHPVEAP